MTTPDNSRSLSLVVEYDQRINLALQQNAVPVVKVIRLRNDSDRPFTDLTLVVDLVPDLATRWSQEVGRIDPGMTVNIEPIDLHLLPERLVSVTERLVGRLTLTIRREEDLILEVEHPVDVLAYNEWGGVEGLPELLAAFVLPNHPAIEGVLARARDLLGEATGDPSLEGYQSRNPGRVRQITASIYAALQAHGVTYSTPPASFERTGQKIRTPEQVLESKLGTCLDLTVLAAACLEQVGLNALLVLVEGHAFSGCWLVDSHFPEAAVEDPLRVRKRVDLGDLCVFDVAAAAARPLQNFETAEKSGRAHLDDPDRFLQAIDVSSARERRVLPLPARVGAASFEPAKPERPNLGGATAIPGVGVPGRPKAADETQLESSKDRERTRIDRWKEQLLDLSLRNRLLNYRETKSHVPLATTDLAGLEDALAQGGTIEIWSKHDLMSGRDPRNAATHVQRTGEDPVEAFLADELRADRLRSRLTEAELKKRLIKIFRDSRTSRQEGGANILYLAIGFLAWPEHPGAETQRLAPILLLPLELIRGVGTQPFKLRLAEEEPRINVTLLKKLEVEHGLSVEGIEGIERLPEDEAGLDIELIFHAFRRAVIDLPRCEVLEQAVLGLFSFTKFLMWRDLEERSASLLQNSVVRHLVEGDDHPFPTTCELLSPEQLDATGTPQQTFNVVDADSSQLAAIVAADEGQSFVLEGPPGTGKSQTITNLIANCLGQGKTVLFVSEKMAALEVVHARLEAVGLEPFCLELHSNKTRKPDALASLKRALDVGKKRAPRGWTQSTAELLGLREELNAHAEAIHRPRSFGESIYEVTSRLIGLTEAPRLPVEVESPDALDDELLANQRRAIDALRTASATVGTTTSHTWRAADTTEWTPQLQREVSTKLDDLDRSACRLQAAAAGAAEALGLPATEDSREDLRRLDELASLLLETPRPPKQLLLATNWEATEGAVTDWLSHGLEHRRLEGKLDERWETGGLLALDLNQLRQKVQRWSTLFFLLAWFMLFTTKRALKTTLRPGRALPATGELEVELTTALALREEHETLESVDQAARQWLGSAWQGVDSDWEALEGALRWCGKLHAILGPRPMQDLIVDQALAPIESNPDVETDSAALRELRELHKIYAEVETARRWLDETLELDIDAAWGAPREAGSLQRLREGVSEMKEGLTSLRDWCVYRRAAKAAAALGLRPLVEAHRAGQLAEAALDECFQRSVFEWWLETIVAEEDVLRHFYGAEHDRKIERFRELDAKLLTLTQKVIVATLAKQIPDPALEETLAAELKLLGREIKKKRRHIPIRTLFDKIKMLLPRLKPCLLMSPLSVAQYLDTNLPPYDVVVFDEASQIPVWDSIGALARGKAAVIVGDTKQLPPTSFFAAGESDDFATEDDFEELESILDECVAAGLPQHRLLWHYRSRHESLITFSNYHYYDNSLLTFPCAASGDRRLGISHHPVPEGVYDRRKSRTNRAEAEALVADVLRRATDPIERRRTLGVVTFSQAQQALILDLLDREAQSCPELEAFIGDEATEPFFVKNLENVQGDERDVMLFSICYGQDASGRVAMQFGPLNRRGGERRLNVAITRAREALVVFSTLRPDQIDLSRTSSEAVRHLKTFLDYASRGDRAIGEALHRDDYPSDDSPFEQAIRCALEDRGWRVHEQVGASGYRVDLAVEDPDTPGRYLLGVECDGPNYRSARSARDRDRLRAMVLERLGWSLHRVWSTDWWLDSKRELLKLEHALARAMKARPGLHRVEK